MAEIKKIPTEYLPVFCQELHQLIRSGMTVQSSIEMIKEDEKDKSIKKALDIIYESLDMGNSLSDALSEGASGFFPSYMIDMISLAEQTGNLENILLSLQHYYERQIRLSKSIKNAMIVPCTLLVVMIAIVGLLIIKVLPIFNEAFHQLGIQMGSMAIMMMNMGSKISSMGKIFSIIFVVFAILVLLIIISSTLREKLINILWQNPNKLLKSILESRLSYSLSLSVSAGMSLDESLDIVEKLCSNSGWLVEKIQNCREDITNGESIFDSMLKNEILTVRDSKMLKIAEQTGSLPETLETIAENQENESLHSIEKLINAIEPTIVVISSILMGTILLSVMLPLLGIISSM